MKITTPPKLTPSWDPPKKVTPAPYFRFHFWGWKNTPQNGRRRRANILGFWELKTLISKCNTFLGRRRRPEILAIGGGIFREGSILFDLLRSKKYLPPNADSIFSSENSFWEISTLMGVGRVIFNSPVLLPPLIIFSTAFGSFEGSIPPSSVPLDSENFATLPLHHPRMI